MPFLKLHDEQETHKTQHVFQMACCKLIQARKIETKRIIMLSLKPSFWKTDQNYEQCFVLRKKGFLCLGTYSD